MKHLLCLGLLAFILSGCFEIREEVNLHADGSGTIVLTLDFSESKDQVREYWAAGNVNGYRLPAEEDFHNLFRIIRNSMQLSGGMTDVSYSLDFDNFTGQVRASFPDVATLNRALTAVTRNLDWLYVPPIEGDNFAWTGTTFKRLYPFPEPPEDFDYDKLPLMTRYLLETARVVGIYRFDQQVRRATNPHAELSANGKAVMVRLPLAELARRQTTLENDILLVDRP